MTLRIRDIRNEEGHTLRRPVRHNKDHIEWKRAQVTLTPAQWITVQYICHFTLMTEGYIRTLIHQFERERLAMLKPRWDPGNRHKFSDTVRERIVALATSRPRDLGLPFGQWSLCRLRNKVLRQEIVPSISLEWLRVTCDEADISKQSIRTWKVSHDPLLEEKKRRIGRSHPHSA